MTKFETWLMDKGYDKYILDHQTMTYRLAKEHFISTMVNLDHRYFPSEYRDLIDGKSVDELGDIRKYEVVFGLNERHKPPTLIYPRPYILTPKGVRQSMDDEVNDMLINLDFNTIWQCMYEDGLYLKKENDKWHITRL